MEKNIYALEFNEQLDVREDVEVLNSERSLLDATVGIVVDVGKTKKTIKEIKSLKEGDYLILNKLLDEGLSINVNNGLVGYGENVLLDGKLGVNIIKLNK